MSKDQEAPPPRPSRKNAPPKTPPSLAPRKNIPLSEYIKNREKNKKPLTSLEKLYIARQIAEITESLRNEGMHIFDYKLKNFIVTSDDGQAIKIEKGDQFSKKAKKEAKFRAISTQDDVLNMNILFQEIGLDSFDINDIDGIIREVNKRINKIEQEHWRIFNEELNKDELKDSNLSGDLRSSEIKPNDPVFDPKENLKHMDSIDIDTLFLRDDNSKKYIYIDDEERVELAIYFLKAASQIKGAFYPQNIHVPIENGKIIPNKIHIDTDDIDDDLMIDFGEANQMQINYVLEKLGFRSPAELIDAYKEMQQARAEQSERAKKEISLKDKKREKPSLKEIYDALSEKIEKVHEQLEDVSHSINRENQKIKSEVFEMMLTISEVTFSDKLLTSLREVKRNLSNQGTPEDMQILIKSIADLESLPEYWEKAAANKRMEAIGKDERSAAEIEEAAKEIENYARNQIKLKRVEAALSLYRVEQEKHSVEQLDENKEITIERVEAGLDELDKVCEAVQDAAKILSPKTKEDIIEIVEEVQNENKEDREKLEYVKESENNNVPESSLRRLWNALQQRVSRLINGITSLFSNKPEVRDNLLEDAGKISTPSHRDSPRRKQS